MPKFKAEKSVHGAPVSPTHITVIVCVCTASTHITVTDIPVTTVIDITTFITAHWHRSFPVLWF